MIWSLIVTAFWAMLPAYVPNNVAVLAGGGRPIDGGRTWNGRRLLGDGKTWRGTATGVLVGFLLAILLNLIRGATTGILGVDRIPIFEYGAALGLAIGAMLGDIGASFLKRRLGHDRGASVPLLDQFDFVLGALGLSFVVAPTWWFETFTLGVLVVIVVITPVLHLGTNVIAYELGFKNEPW